MVDRVAVWTSVGLILLQSNRLTVMEGLEQLVNLEEVYLSHNGIREVQGLDNLVRPGGRGLPFSG